MHSHIISRENLSSLVDNDFIIFLVLYITEVIAGITFAPIDRA